MYKVILVIGDCEFSQEIEIECELRKGAEEIIFAAERYGDNIVAAYIK